MPFMETHIPFIEPAPHAHGLCSVLARAACLLLLVAPLVHAVAPADDAVIAQELKANDDPTILQRRAWLDSEWNEFENHGRDVLETVGALWSWRVDAAQDWAVRIKVPVEFHDAGDPGGSSKQGLGDIKLATGSAWRFDDRLRAGLGLELRTPSGTDDDLSNDAWQLQQFASVAFDATPWLTLAPAFEYNRSIEEEPGVAPRHFLEMFLPAIFLLPQRWAITTRLEAKVDFENGNEWTHSGKVVVAKQLESVPVGLALSFKQAFDSSEKAFQVNFIATYYL